MNIDAYEQASRNFDAAEAKVQAVPSVDDEVALDFLCALPPLEYDRNRKTEAKRLRVSIGALERAVEARRRRMVSAFTKAHNQGSQLLEFEPSKEPVNGEQMMRLLVATIERYVVLPSLGSVAIALWIVRAHAHECFDVNPRLAFLSPEKRCGKSTALEVLSSLTPRALLASNATPASLFRFIEAVKPTLILDEMDTFKDSHPDLRGVLNSGHRRSAAFVLRCVGDEHEPKAFSTWCPMVFAAIGKLPDTLEDRSIIIRMRRRARHEIVQRLRWTGQRGEALRTSLTVLGQAVVRWVGDHAEALRQQDPAVPEQLNDRAGDNWTPLIAIADVIGGEWSEWARAAAIELSTSQKSQDDSIGVQLLSDIRTIVYASRVDRMSSKELCKQLAALEEQPWQAWRHSRPLTPAQLARLLRPFEIRSQDIWQQKRCAKGYALEAFREAFDRYLPDCLPHSAQDSDALVREDARLSSGSGVPDNSACARHSVSRVSINERIATAGALPRGLAGQQPGGTQKAGVDSRCEELREMWRRAKPIHEARK